jgi:hypothetical protein
METCSLCERKPIARGLCKPCYYRMRRNGTLKDHAWTRPPLEERFNAFVNKTTSCWLWTGATNRGYGLLWVDGKHELAHRVSYSIHKGLLGDLCVCHTCDTPLCVNPDHLFLGTREDNNLDARHKLRHAFGERNGHARLTKEQVAWARASQLPQAEIARILGVHQSHVSRIRSGDAWGLL